MIMDAFLDKIVSTENLAILVLMVVCIALYRLYREERTLDRDARKADVLQFAAVTDRQTEAIKELTKVLTELRLESAGSRGNSPHSPSH